MSVPYKTIADAPLDGTEIQLIDVGAETPEWGVGFYLPEYGAFFGGYRREYDEVCEDIRRGDTDAEELDDMFWAQPTHWAPVLPVPFQ